MTVDRRQVADTRPAVRTEGLITEELDGELLIYDRVRDKAHCLNGSAAVVWRHCDGTRTVEELGRLIAPEADPELRGELALAALNQLERRHLLAEGLPVGSAVSRRELMRKAALVGAVGLALPVVKSIVAPTAAQAATCLPGGAACSSSAQCCSGICAETSPGSGVFACA